MKLLTFATLLVLFRLGGCTDTQLQESRIGEQLYIDLLYNIVNENPTAAFEAVESLHIQLDRLRGNWQRPMSKENAKACRQHLDEAENAFSDVRAAVKEQNFAQAEIQLDRAMSELAAADRRAFTQLYVGQLYDFYVIWQEVDLIVNDQMLCLMEWQEFVWWVNQARTEWQAIECIAPNPELYALDTFAQQRFLAAQQTLSKKLEAYGKIVGRGDQCISQDYAAEVTNTLWELMLAVKGKEDPALELLEK